MVTSLHLMLVSALQNTHTALLHLSPLPTIHSYQSRVVAGGWLSKSVVMTVNCRQDGDVTQLSSVLILPNLYSQWQIRHKIDSTHAMQFMLTLICSSNVEFHCTNWKAILYWVMVVYSPSIHFQAATGGTCYITKNIFSNWTWKTIRKQLLMQHQRLLHGNHHVQLKVLQEKSGTLDSQMYQFFLKSPSASPSIAVIYGYYQGILIQALD